MGLFDTIRGAVSGSGTNDDRREAESDLLDSTALDPDDFHDYAEFVAEENSLDFSIRSLDRLDSLVSTADIETAGSGAAEQTYSETTIKLGSYLGSVLVETYDGRWIQTDSWAVSVPGADEDVTVKVFEVAVKSIAESPVFAAVAEQLEAKTASETEPDAETDDVETDDGERDADDTDDGEIAVPTAESNMVDATEQSAVESRSESLDDDQPDEEPVDSTTDDEPPSTDDTQRSDVETDRQSATEESDATEVDDQTAEAETHDSDRERPTVVEDGTEREDSSVAEPDASGADETTVASADADPDEPTVASDERGTAATPIPDAESPAEQSRPVTTGADESPATTPADTDESESENSLIDADGTDSSVDDDQPPSTPAADTTDYDEPRAEYAETAVDFADFWSERDLDFSPTSLERLDALVDGEWDSTRFTDATFGSAESFDDRAFTTLVRELGSYFGEILVRELDGVWTDEIDHEAAVVVEGPAGRLAVPVFDIADTSLRKRAVFEQSYDALLDDLGREDSTGQDGEIP